MRNVAYEFASVNRRSMAKVSYQQPVETVVDKDISAYLVIVPDITIPSDFVESNYLSAYDLGGIKRLPIDLNLIPKPDLIIDTLMGGFKE